MIVVAMSLLAACQRGTGARSLARTPTTTTIAPSCASGRSHAAGQTEEHITVEGVDRTYLLYVPASYRGDTNVAVVFDFHGFGSSAAQQIAYGNFRPLADRDGFIVAAPDGQGIPRHFTLLGPDRARSTTSP